MKNATGKKSLPGEAREAIANYLRKRDGLRMVSACDTISHLRARFPDLEVADQLLTDVVAGVAIVLGLDYKIGGVCKGRVLYDRWARSAASSNGA